VRRAVRGGSQYGRRHDPPAPNRRSGQQQRRHPQFRVSRPRSSSAPSGTSVSPPAARRSPIASRNASTGLCRIPTKAVADDRSVRPLEPAGSDDHQIFGESRSGCARSAAHLRIRPRASVRVRRSARSHSCFRWRRSGYCLATRLSEYRCRLGRLRHFRYGSRFRFV
jgi:hypothetical protein